MYQNNTILHHPTRIVLRLLDETLLPRYSKESYEGHTQYSGFGRGNITVRHDPVPRGAFVHVRRPFNRETAAELLRKLKLEGLNVEEGLPTEDGRYYLISE